MISEERTQKAVATYLRLAFPKALFNTDLSGIKLTKGQAGKVSFLRSGRAYPDMVIYESRRGFSALFIELKRPDTKIYKKDGNMVADPHIREQADMLSELQRRGYCARFAVGFDEAKKLIDWYLQD